MANLFLIDDHPDIRQVIEQLLTMYSHSVQCFASANEALAALSQTTPDGLIADHRLPDLTGLELLTRVRANPDHAAIYFVLCSGDDTVKESAMQAGANDFWPKGSDIVFDRIAKLEDVLSQRRNV